VPTRSAIRTAAVTAALHAMLEADNTAIRVRPDDDADATLTPL